MTTVMTPIMMMTINMMNHDSDDHNAEHQDEEDKELITMINNDGDSWW